MVQTYTVVLCETPAGMLLVARAKPPYRGLWNGLGGKVEPGETPLAGAIREVQEESGAIIRPNQIWPRGLVRWFVDGQRLGDLHLFYGTAAAPALPQTTREGVVAAWPRPWLLAPDNQGLTPDLPSLLPYFLGGQNLLLASAFTGDHFDGITVLGDRDD